MPIFYSLPAYFPSSLSAKQCVIPKLDEITICFAQNNFTPPPDEFQIVDWEMTTKEDAYP